MGSTTTFAYSYDPDGTFVQTATVVDTGATYITKTARDGTLLQIVGTGASPVKYYYGVESTGDTSPDGPIYAIYTQEVKVSSTGAETEWTKTYQDMLGLPYKRIYASSGSAPTRQLYLNNKGQIVRAKDPDGVQWLFQYDTRGRLEYEVLDVDRNGVIDFAGSDRITQIQRSILNDATLGANVVREQRVVWDTVGVNASTPVWTVSARTDGLTAWSAIWNGASAVTTKFQITYPVTGTTRFTQTYPNNAIQVIDSIGRLVQSVTDKDSAGAQMTRTSYTYDPHGRPQVVTDARDGATTRTFNNADQVTSLTTPTPGDGGNAQVTVASYDGLGRLWRVQQPDGKYTYTDYTIRNETKKVYGAWTYSTEYSYDAQGRLETLKTWQDYTAGTGTNITQWVYDSYRGFLQTRKLGLTTGPSYTYTAAGRQSTRVWARGITTTYTYNNAGELYTVGYSDGTTPGVTQTYDRRGRIGTITQNGIVTTKGYNGANQLLSEGYSGGVLNGLTVNHTYDTLLRKNSASVSGYTGTLNNYTYDNANRLSTVGDGTYAATYTYLANSPLVSKITDKQTTTTRLTINKQYDFLDRLQFINAVPTGANTGPFYSGYAYNDLDQRTKSTAADGSYWSYGYDSIGQLTSAVRRWVDGTRVEGEQFGYVFDDIGNRKSTTQGGDTAGANLRSATYTPDTLNKYSSRTVPNAVDIVGTSTAVNTVTVNGANAQHRKGSFFRHQLTVSNGSGPAYTAVTVTADTTKTGNILTPPASQSFSYDGDGNMTGDSVFTYTYNGENQLIEVQSLSGNPAASKKWDKFTYDWRGRRIQKSTQTWNTGTGTWNAAVLTRYLYSGWNLIGELNGSSGNAFIRGYIWGLDLSGTLQGAGGVGGLIAENDAVNGVQFAVCDDMGNVVGFVKGSDGTVTATYEYDPFGNLIRATGPYASVNPIRFSSKYYDDEVGLSFFGGRYYNASLGRWLNRDPMQEQGGNNLYGFCFNEPTDYIDPDGQFALSAGFLIYDTIQLGHNLRNHNASLMDGVMVAADLGALAADFFSGGLGGDGLESLRGAEAIAVAAKAVSPAAVANAAAHAGKTLGDLWNAMTGEGNKSSSSIEKKIKGCKPKKNGETEATREGKKEHKEWDPGPGYEKEFELPSGKKVDAVNFEKQHVKELKPENARQIRRGNRQAEGYIHEFEDWLDQENEWNYDIETYKRKT